MHDICCLLQVLVFFRGGDFTFQLIWNIIFFYGIQNIVFFIFYFLFVIGSEYNVNISPKKNWNIIQYDKNQHVSRHIKVSSSFFLFPKYLKYFLKLSCDLCQILFLFLFFGRTSNTCQFFLLKKIKIKRLLINVYVENMKFTNHCKM